MKRNHIIIIAAVAGVLVLFAGYRLVFPKNQMEIMAVTGATPLAVKQDVKSGTTLEVSGLTKKVYKFGADALNAFAKAVAEAFNSSSSVASSDGLSRRASWDRAGSGNATCDIASPSNTPAKVAMTNRVLIRWSPAPNCQLSLVLRQSHSPTDMIRPGHIPHFFGRAGVDRTKRSALDHFQHPFLGQVGTNLSPQGDALRIGNPLEDLRKAPQNPDGT